MPVSDADVIVRVAAKGDGVTGDGRHVPLSAPGDRLLPDGGLEAGAHHAQPPCTHFPACGGCQLQHLDAESYAAFVRDRVEGALAGQGVVVDHFDTPHISPPASRRRAALRAIRNGRAVRIGFNEGNSHNIVDMKMCAVLHPALFALVAPLRELLAKMLPDRGSARIMMTLVDQGIDLLMEGIVAEGLAAIEALSDFAREHRLARLSLDDGFGPQAQWEPEPVTITLGGVAVAVPPFAFLQATQDGEAALLNVARQGIGESRRVADLFAGLGTFAFGVGEGRQVYAAEAARDMVLAMKVAANRAGRMLGADHRDLFRRPLTPQELERFDAVLIDPPRAGAREQVAQLAQAHVPTLVYISCNPSSFARDAATLLAGGYRCDYVRPVGQFLWSTHVELAAVFRR